ncbi:4'-phosphopantetheinyl transferase family protein [Streptomyces olivaceoviridis]|uniref:4'-phosphopantetheinyl transferase family protein n=1 Tax=Streptomyces olivaceoviridis TaxID=1921 RepID=UPI0036FCD226
MIADVLPSPVIAYDTFTDAPHDALLPEEHAVVAAAVEKRRREFTTVRALARTAMHALGCPPAPVLPNRRGAPGWPEGLVGSMTHCDGYRAVALARAVDVIAVGIDAEPDAPLPEGVLAAVSLPAERAWISDLTAARAEVSWDRLLFSIKESIFKAWYPRTRYELGFEQAEVTVCPQSHTFTCRLILPEQAPPSSWLTDTRGRWLVRDGLLVTSLAVPAGRPGTGPDARC